MNDTNINVRELLETYNIDYKVSGKNLIIKCFNHEDKHPSLSINEQGGYFNCFSCGCSGSYSQLYKLVTGQDYQYSSIDFWAYNSYKPRVKKDIEATNNIKKIKVYGKLLNPLENSTIREWLRKYGIENDDVIIQHGIKYATYAEMIEESLDTNEECTKVVNRIVTPIYDIHGNIINYECRAYDGSIPKVLYIKGGSVQSLYNWNNIDTSKDIVVCEGIKGWWRLQNVYPNSIAMYHNIPTDYQFELLNSVPGTKVFFLDNDAGAWGKFNSNGTIKRKGTVQYLEEFLTTDFKICYSPIKGYDPNDCNYIDIKRIISNAMYYNEYKVNSMFNTKKEEW
jgi:hypothetical protein